MQDLARGVDKNIQRAVKNIVIQKCHRGLLLCDRPDDAANGNPGCDLPDSLTPALPDSFLFQLSQRVVQAAHRVAQ